MRRRLASLLALTLVLPVAGCSGGDSAHAGVASRPAVSSAGAQAAGVRQVDWWPAGPKAVPVSGLVPRSLSHDDPTLPTSLRWVDAPGATALNAAVAAWAGAAEKDFLASSAPDTTAPPELTVDAAPILASGRLVGMRSQLRAFRGANGELTHRTWYADTTTTTVWTAPDLVAPGRVPALARTALTSPAVSVTSGSGETPTTAKGPALTDLAGVELADAVTDVWFTPGGDLVLGVDQGTVLPASQGAVVLTVPRALVDRYLSDAGRAVQAAFVSPAPYAPGATAGLIPLPSPPAADPVNCAKARCVALTFDDGPGQYTTTLLDELRTANAKATFFVIGQSAAAAPDVVRRELAEGMAVGNHTWDHRQLTTLTPAKQADELKRTREVLERLGVPLPLLRPPYGSFNKATRGLGFPIILWNVDTEDWKNLDTAETTRRALAGARPGAIILMHDIHPSTVRAVPGIIAGLRAKGLTPVTVPQLLGGAPKAGKAYYSRTDIK